MKCENNKLPRIQVPVSVATRRKVRMLAAMDDESMAYWLQQRIEELVNLRYKQELSKD